MTDKSIKLYGEVSKVLVEQLGVEYWQLELSALLEEDLGADSLDLVEVIIALEEQFSISINEDKFEGDTVWDVVYSTGQLVNVEANDFIIRTHFATKFPHSCTDSNTPLQEHSPAENNTPLPKVTSTLCDGTTTLEQLQTFAKETSFVITIYAEGVNLSCNGVEYSLDKDNIESIMSCIETLNKFTQGGDNCENNT